MASKNPAELWAQIVEIHNQTKAQLIYCEEAGIDHFTFIQPRNELCNALEHVVRAKAFELGLSSPGPDAGNDYVGDNLDKVLGHEYRAFFDVCDWLTIILRERIQEILEPYPREIIQSVIPDYYLTIRTQLDEISPRIAEIRTKKDIRGDILGEVHAYNQLLGELKAFHSSLSAKIPLLEDAVFHIRARDGIVELLKPYSSDAIQKVIPDYYSKIRPQLEGVSPNAEELRNFRGTLARKIPVLDEVKGHEERKKWWAVILVVGGAALGAFFKWLWDQTHR